jgi:hypothetical protein
MTLNGFELHGVHVILNEWLDSHSMGHMNDLRSVKLHIGSESLAILRRIGTSHDKRDVWVVEQSQPELTGKIQARTIRTK